MCWNAVAFRGHDHITSSVLSLDTPAIMSTVSISPSQALSIAEALFTSRYADAMFAFAAGSIVRGQGTHLSDIDLVVVYEHLESARRESFMADGVPVESFVHDPATLAWFMDADIDRGVPSILNMIAEGRIIGSLTDRARRLQEDAVRRLSSGPPGMNPEHLNALRYDLTDAMNDLKGTRSPGEVMAIGTLLYPRLAELCLRNCAKWNGIGKWAPRLLTEMDPDLAARFEHAFRNLFIASSCTAVIALAEQELEAVGGPLFEGDCRIAPASWRK